MKTQMHLEDVFYNIATGSDRPVIILCDRGVMDGQAYSDPVVWQTVMDEMGWSTVQLRDRRYEAIIHMVTAASGAEHFYDQGSNEARYETAEMARMTDKKLIDAWCGHSNFCIIKNNVHSFEEKINKVLDTVLRFVGMPVPSTLV